MNEFFGNLSEMYRPFTTSARLQNLVESLLSEVEAVKTYYVHEQDVQQSQMGVNLSTSKTRT